MSKTSPMPRVIAIAVAVAAGATVAAVTAPTAFAAPGGSPAKPPVALAQRTAGPAKGTAWNPHVVDFNGDGRPDVAVGAPGGTIGDATKAGYVSVVYGGSKGLDPATHVDISQNTPGVPGPAVTGNAFGTSVVPADLNGDGYTDLVVGTPGADDGAAVDVGTVTILWGGPQGLTTGTTLDTGEPPTDRSGLGRVVVAGDFDGDGTPDLAMISGESDVRFFYDVGQDGTAARTADMDLGLTENDSVITQDIAAGDVNGDGITDLVAIDTDTDEEDAYRGTLFLGGGGGGSDGSAGMTRVGVLKDAKGNNLSGEQAAIGDLNHDGYGDIVIGHGIDGFDSDVDLPTKGGALGIAYGGSHGLSTTLKPVWINQDTTGVPGVGERGDGMGTSVAVEDVNGDGYADVVTGVPNEEFSGIPGAGSFLILKGGPKGLTGSGAQVFSQNTSGFPGVAEKDDHFGATVAVLGATATEGAQVVIGDPDENAGNGSVWAMGVAAAGPTATGTISFGPGTMGSPATDAAFGSSLTGR